MSPVFSTSQNALISENSGSSEKILCLYINKSAHLQVIRLQQNATIFERAIFPDERFLFHASPTAYLEVKLNSKAAFILSCKTIQVLESLSPIQDEN